LWLSFFDHRFSAAFFAISFLRSGDSYFSAKFGDALRSRTERAQINEALCKVLCHNICCLIQSMFELGLKPKFYAEVA